MNLFANLNNIGGWHVGLNSPFAFAFGFLVIVAVVWSMVWKGIALWKSSRLGHKIWFVVMLITNTLGVLEILYIFFFSKPSKKIDGGRA